MVGFASFRPAMSIERSGMNQSVKIVRNGSSAAQEQVVGQFDVAHRGATGRGTPRPMLCGSFRSDRSARTPPRGHQTERGTIAGGGGAANSRGSAQGTEKPPFWTEHS